VISWDVVNEAMNDNPPNPADWKASLRQSPWYQAIGPDYVEQAFLAAREVLDAHPDWDITLYYNDYYDDNQNKATAIYNMVKELNDNYAKENPGKMLIDGVGMQGHYNINTNPANVELSLERFISLGVEVSITELDVQAGSNFELTSEQANAQGYLYAQLMDIFKKHADHIKRITFWGMDDGSSWRSSTNPLLFDRNLQAKPAYYGVIDPAKFMEEHQPETKEALQSYAVFGTPIIDGETDTVWSKAQAMPINRYQSAWQGATGTAKALWDDENLYVLIQVSDEQLDKASPDPWEQDSIEIFVDENHARTTFYQEDDGQYRVNFDNETSFNPAGIEEGFDSAVKVEGTNYTVEVKIPFKHITPTANISIGFDVQVNDGKDGARQSVAAWNDTTGTGYMDPSVFGILTLSDGEAAFSDLADAAWAQESIETLAARGIVVGIDAQTFEPNRAITTAEFIQMIVRGLDLQQEGATTADVQQGAWYYDAVASAQTLGMLDDLFDSADGWNDPINRQQLAVIAYRALEKAGVSLEAAASSGAASIDNDAIATYALEAVRALNEAGLLPANENGEFDPLGTLSRAEAAVMIHRILNL